MANTKPYVQAAMICDNIIQDKDNVFSAIRIVDTLTLPAQLPPAGDLKPTVHLKLFVSIKSGDVTGSHEVSFRLKKPDGSYAKKDAGKYPVELLGQTNGATFMLSLVIDPVLGHHLIEVLFDGELLTAVPFLMQQQAEETTTN
jgi:hypothetical protein